MALGEHVNGVFTGNDNLQLLVEKRGKMSSHSDVYIESSNIVCVCVYELMFLGFYFRGAWMGCGEWGAGGRFEMVMGVN